MSTLFNRDDAIKKISNHLSLLELSTKNLGLLRLFDQNIIAESFAASLLNEVYDYGLVNLNKIDPTFAATDLGDTNQRIAFQVTYTGKKNHRTKIQTSIDKFVKKQMYQDYDRLLFLFLGPKQKTYKMPFKTGGHLKFNPQSDVLNLGDVIKQLSGLPTQKLQGLSTIVDQEFSLAQAQKQNSLVERPTDSDALEAIRNAFDRPAFQDPFWIESDYAAFEKALTDLIGLLKTGMLNGVSISKPYQDFDDRSISKDVDKVYHKLTAIRRLFNVYKRSGEINTSTNSARFNSPDTSDAFDKFRQDIINQLNLILHSYGIQIVTGITGIPKFP